MGPLGNSRGKRPRRPWGNTASTAWSSRPTALLTIPAPPSWIAPNPGHVPLLDRPNHAQGQKSLRLRRNLRLPALTLARFPLLVNRVWSGSILNLSCWRSGLACPQLGSIPQAGPKPNLLRPPCKRPSLGGISPANKSANKPCFFTNTCHFLLVWQMASGFQGHGKSSGELSSVMILNPMRNWQQSSERYGASRTVKHHMSNKLFVGNLSFDTPENDLQDGFAQIS